MNVNCRVRLKTSVHILWVIIGCLCHSPTLLRDVFGHNGIYLALTLYKYWAISSVCLHRLHTCLRDSVLYCLSWFFADASFALLSERPINVYGINSDTFLVFRLRRRVFYKALGRSSFPTQPPSDQRDPQRERRSWRAIRRHDRSHAGPQTAGPVPDGSSGRNKLGSLNAHWRLCFYRLVNS